MPVIRHAREDEVGALTAVGLRAWEGAIVGLADVGRMRRLAENAFGDFLANHWLSVSLIEVDGRPRGWAARENFDEMISDLWIEPEAQRRGLGGRLLADIELRISNDGFDAAKTKTHAKNTAAIGFFRKHGYGVTWLSTSYAPKLDRDVEYIGLGKPLAVTDLGLYGR
ncbi:MULTISPECIES: GNAT family N-acetyltransferase [Ensifer]|jgi:[ribosomal protein S18]-alanine N-acetyltransferase|uniref:GNAT family N-acetyltransferase n=1 Tax=Ensifer canadensis TaxID=555315 RepID=A0AAW4FBP5_9HYPH|nr:MULTISPECIES: GNAT family N-acetyltransferase [Ensifer]KQU71895.1 acetyltransferase [Ensifer sp. Root31]KQW44081.1 acetyltransferase [Ensifer sp. Root1252]KQW84232.1 acetyltransferase [Ensifer sp. Root127]KQY61158.1 acetyltransferase [Ensifer sp. Root142]KRC57795.1 acetyltransferase [Ensifer sp. Root231]